MLDLKDFLETLCNISGVHFSIVDTSGILNCEHFELPTKYKIHKTDFCDFAKTTNEGYERCICEKTQSNHIAMSGKTTCRVCPFGIFKIVKPVIINSQVICILHICNLILDYDEFQNKISEYISKVNIDDKEFFELAKSIPKISNKADYLKITDIVACHIQFMLECYGKKEIHGKYHWLSEALTIYINENYERDISLTSFASNYKMNIKYIGKVFYKDTGMHFSQYLNTIRLQHAEKMLMGEKNITEVALATGFNSVSYFNRIFKETYSMTPSQYIERYKLVEMQHFS